MADDGPEAADDQQHLQEERGMSDVQRIALDRLVPQPPAANKGYDTVFVAVPAQELLDAMAEAMRVQWRAAA
jgi:hypothetical protein